MQLLLVQRYQRLGFGGRAIEALIAHARTRPGARCMILSFVPEEGSAEAFYRRFGFTPTGEVTEGEHVMRLAF